MSTKIEKFDGKYKFLSNFWPCKVILEGEEYPSVEHAYQAAKSDDKAYQLKVRKAFTAATAKSMGQRVKLRSGWEDMKVSVMSNLIHQKFNFTNGLAQLLLETGDAELIEGNWWGDTFWGVCKGKGSNYLGMLLMDRRTELDNLVKSEDPHAI